MRSTRRAIVATDAAGCAGGAARRGVRRAALPSSPPGNANAAPMRSARIASATAKGVAMVPECVGSAAMADRAALVTGASSGIGLAIAHMLGEEGHALTVAARRPEKLAGAAQELRDAGYEVEEVAANMTSEEEIQAVAGRHRERFGRLDVLVNNAGVGIGAPVAEHQTKRIDMQIDLNLRAIILFYRECADLLRAAGAEHRSALVVNTASIAGKAGSRGCRSTPRPRPRSSTGRNP